MRIASKYRRIRVMQIIFFAITFLLPVCYKKKDLGLSTITSEFFPNSEPTYTY